MITELERCELAKLKGYTYDPKTGYIKGIKGNVIIRKHTNGYVFCCLIHEKKLYNILGHRLAWFLHYGKLPVNNIDHIDGVKTNNKIENLRDVTQQHNNWNQQNAKGYYWGKMHKKFMAQIRVDNKVIYLGKFETEAEARSAYLDAKKKYHVI